MNAIALSVGKLTNIGQVRSRNEDAMDLRQAESDEEPSLFIVADGMGGHSAGNVASQMAVELTLARFFEAAQGDMSDRLRHAIEEANRQIYEAAQTNADYFRMGTTIVAAAALGNQADVACVGDSRVYVVRNGKIQQVTRDHSWVALQVEMGELTPEEAQVSQNRSVLLRCLGEKADVLVDMVQLRLHVGDILILCSDGLHGLVTPEEICSAVTSAEPQKACDDLVALANARGGPDNITVQVVRIDRCPPPPPEEGDEVVIKRMSQPEPPLEPIAPPAVPVAPAAPMFGTETAPVAPPHVPPAPRPPPPPPPPHDNPGSVPWVLIVLSFLAGLITMAVVDRLMPPSPGPTPPGPVATGGLGSPLPVGLPSASAGPATPQAAASVSPLPASPGPRASASAGPEAAPSANPVPTVGAIDLPEPGILVRDRDIIESPAVHRGRIYWLERGVLHDLPVRGGEVTMHRLPAVLPRRVIQIRHLAANHSELFAALDVGIIPLSVTGGVPVPSRKPLDEAQAHIVAASDDRLFWVQKDNRRRIMSQVLHDRKAHPQAEGQAQEEVLGLAVPTGSKGLYWAEQNRGIHQGEKVVVRGHPSALAANSRYLYWTEESGDAVSLNRCRLDGTEKKTLSSLPAGVSSLSADEDRVYWVAPDKSGKAAIRYLDDK